MPPVHVAQLNTAIMVAPPDDPRVAGFMEALDEINAIADATPGFVWRLQTDDGNATGIQVFPNPLHLVNMSVWKSVESLRDYVYGSAHVDFFRRRAEWFEADDRMLALWHVEPGTIPELDEAVRRSEFLQRHGTSPYAFGFSKPPAPLTFSADDTTITATFDGRLVGRITAVGDVEIVDRDVALLTEALRDQHELHSQRRSGA